LDLSSMVFYESLRFFLGPLMPWHFHLKAEGLENVPEEGGALIISNHRCYLDPMVLGYAIERFINFGAGSHLYQVPGAWRLFKLAGFFPVYIYGGREGDESQNQAEHLLQNGELVCIFPEGIESFMDINAVSKIANFKTGFVKVALEARVPIIPTAIAPLEEKQFPRVPGMFVTPFVKHPKAKEGITLVTYRDITLRVGKPIDLSPYYEEVMSKDLIDHIAGKLKRIVIRLYDGKDLDKYLTGETGFNFARDMV
jgi:1-acyl-sn-glycerol-3-phosphate acyltransferase